MYSGECDSRFLGKSDSKIYEPYIFLDDNVGRDPICPFRASSCAFSSDGVMVALYKERDII